MNRSILGTILFIMSCYHLTCGQNSISGHVIDIKGNTVEYATVIVLNNDTLVKGTITDKEGAFLLQSLPVGILKLKINFIGYQPYIQEIKVDGDIDIEKIVLAEETIQLEEIQVTTSKTSVSHQVDKIIYDVPQDIKKKSTDAYQLLQHAPNLSVDIVGRNIELNGQGNILILVNKISRGTNFISSISPKDIERVEIINSPSAKYLSDDISGVINIVTKDQVKGYSGSIGTRQTPTLSFGLSDGYIRCNYKNFSYYAIGQNFFFLEDEHKLKKNRVVEQEGTISRLTKESNNYPFNYVTNYAKLGAEYNFSGNKHIIVDYETFWIDQDEKYIEQAILETEGEPLVNYDIHQQDRDKTQNHTFKLYYQDELGNKGKLLAIAADMNIFGSDSYIKYQENHEDYIYDNEQLLDNSKLSYSVQVDYSQPFDKVKFETGCKIYKQYIDFKYDKYNNKENMEYTQTQGYSYANLLGSISNKWSFQVGLGASIAHVLTNSIFRNRYYPVLPNIGLQYKPNAKHTLKLDYVRLEESPSVAALNPFERFTDSSRVTTGNPYLKPYYTNDIKLSYTYSKGKISFIPSCNYSLTNGYITTIGVLDEGGIYRTSYQNTAQYSILRTNLYSSLKLMKWWTMNFTLKYHIQQFQDNNNNLKKKVTSVGGSIQSTFTYKNFMLQANYYQHPDIIMGNSCYKNAPESVAYLQWSKSDAWSFHIGARYLLPWKYEYTVESDGFFEVYEKSIGERHNLIFMGMRYNFSSGKQNKNINRKIENKDSDANMNEML